MSCLGSELCYCSGEMTVEYRQHVHLDTCWSCGQGLSVVSACAFSGGSSFFCRLWQSGLCLPRRSSLASPPHLLARVVAQSISEMALSCLVPLHCLLLSFTSKE